MTMEWRILRYGGVFMILFLISMVSQWTPFDSLSDDTSSIHQVRSSSSSSSSIVNSPELVDEPKRSGRNRRKVVVESQDMDEETERVLEKAFRTSSDDSKVPKNKTEVRPPDEIALRRRDFKRRRRPESFVLDNIEDKIVFPDQVNVKDQRNLQTAPTCRSGTFCEDPPYYPTEHINQVVKSNTSLKYFETTDELENEPDLVLRSSGRDTKLCESKKVIFRPKVAVNKNNESRFIVNTDTFTQAIGVEICKHENSTCKLVDKFAAGYETMCKQNYIYRELLAITSDNLISLEKFLMPASCCCSVKFVGDSKFRMGHDMKENET